MASIQTSVLVSAGIVVGTAAGKKLKTSLVTDESIRYLRSLLSGVSLAVLYGEVLPESFKRVSNGKQTLNFVFGLVLGLLVSSSVAMLIKVSETKGLTQEETYKDPDVISALFDMFVDGYIFGSVISHLSNLLKITGLSVLVINSFVLAFETSHNATGHYIVVPLLLFIMMSTGVIVGNTIYSKFSLKSGTVLGVTSGMLLYSALRLLPVSKDLGIRTLLPLSVGFFIVRSAQYFHIGDTD